MKTQQNVNYRVVTVKHPVKGGSHLLPMFTKRHVYHTREVATYALDHKHVRGQREDCIGQFCGFMEAIMAIVATGGEVNIDGMFRVHAELKGCLNEKTRRIDPEHNSLHVVFQARKECKIPMKGLKFVEVDEHGRPVQADDAAPAQPAAGQGPADGQA